MKAMILAAGRGERMKPLSDTCPKPLLAVGGKPLIVWQLERLAEAGFREIVINHAHLGAMLEGALGDGAAFGVSITWSPEPEGALETAGGIVNALPLLGSQPFLVSNGDIFCDWDLSHAEMIARRLSAKGDLAHLVMVPNPPERPHGDFVLRASRMFDGAAPRLTFAGIGIYDPRLFSGLTAGEPAKLAPLLRRAMGQDRVGGELHRGRWNDVGTPERLAALDVALRGDGAEV